MKKILTAFIICCAYCTSSFATTYQLYNAHYLDVGNYWNYDIHITKMNNEDTDLWDGGAMEITDTNKVNGVTTKMVEMYSSSGINTKYCVQDANFILMYKEAEDNFSSIFSDDNPLEIYPVSISTKDKNSHFGNGNFSYNQFSPPAAWNSVIDCNVTYLRQEYVTVTAGSYRCNVIYIKTIRLDDDGYKLTSEETDWIDPQVGLIQSDYKNTTWDGQTNWVDEYSYELSSTNVEAGEYLIAAEPEITPGGGASITPMEVSLSCPAEDVDIYYTIDGTEPTANSNLYDGNSITLSRSCTVKAKGIQDGYMDSNAVSAVFTIGPVISGFVKKTDGTPVANVTIYGSYNAGKTTTDSSGYYALRVPYNWSGSIKPTKTNCTLAPAYKMYSSVTSTINNQGFTIYTNPAISGYARTPGGTTMSGVTVTASNGGGVTVTNTRGYYELRVPYNWKGTVSSSKSYCSWSPSSRAYGTAVTSSKTYQNFTAYSWPTISGYVRTSGGTGISGVKMIASGVSGTATTSSTGYYTLRVPYKWTGTIKPSKSYYSWSPSSRAYTSAITSSKSSQNFTGYAWPTISGYVKTSGGTPISGVTLTTSSGSKATTNTKGYYAFRVPYNWTSSIKPSKTGYIFIPASKSYTGVISSKSSQNYVGKH